MPPIPFTQDGDVEGVERHAAAFHELKSVFMQQAAHILLSKMPQVSRNIIGRPVLAVVIGVPASPIRYGDHEHTIFSCSREQLLHAASQVMEVLKHMPQGDHLELFPGLDQLELGKHGKCMVGNGLLPGLDLRFHALDQVLVLLELCQELPGPTANIQYAAFGLKSFDKVHLLAQRMRTHTLIGRRHETLSGVGVRNVLLRRIVSADRVRTRPWRGEPEATVHTINQGKGLLANGMVKHRAPDLQVGSSADRTSEE